MKTPILAYLAPAELMESWSDVALTAGFRVEFDAEPNVVVVSDIPTAQSITCRWGTVYQDNMRIRVCPSAGGPPHSASPVAGKLVILVFYYLDDSQEGFAPSVELAHEFGKLLIRTGATLVPLRRRERN